MGDDGLIGVVDFWNGLTDDAWKRVRSLLELIGSRGKLQQLVGTALDGTIDRNTLAQVLKGSVAGSVKAPQASCDAGAGSHHPLASERGHQPDNGAVRDPEHLGEISERRGKPVVELEPLDSSERFGLTGSWSAESIFGSGHVKASGG
jgi:hypothetical protein